MAIENIILDIGNVICRWDADGLMRGIFDNDEDIARAHAATVADPDWLDLDRGTIALPDAVAKAQNRTDLDPQKIAKIFQNLAPSLVPIDSTVAAIRKLHQQGVPLYVLSNMHDHSWQYLSENFDFWSCFDGIVVSYEINLIKPDPAIYHYILERFSLDPDVTAFVDDMPENITAANDVGIQGTVLRNPDDGARVITELVAA